MGQAEARPFRLGEWVVHPPTGVLRSDTEVRRLEPLTMDVLVMLATRGAVVAVVENRTGDPALDNLGTMAADWVTQGLSQTGLVEVVPSVSVIMASRAPDGGRPGHFDVATIRPYGLRVLGHPRARLGDAAPTAPYPQLERRRFAA